MTGSEIIRQNHSSRARLLGLLLLAGALVGGGSSASAGPQAANGRIAFVSDGACRFDPAVKNEDVYSIAPDGTGRANLSRNANPDSAPSWSADGTMLAFTRPGKGGGDDVFVMNANGKGQRNLTRSSPEDANPDWAPDNSKVAYDVGGAQIFSSNADGTAMQRLIPGGFAPSWAPSGLQMAYTQNVEPSNSEIFVANADGSGAHNVTNATGYDDDGAAWSPDGMKIAFTRYIGQAGEIFLMNPDGSGLVNLTNDPSNDAEPTWSPDGTKIAFSTNRGPTGDMEIFVMNADGSNPVNVTKSPANDTDPDWQPVPGTAAPVPGAEKFCKVPNLAGKKVRPARSLLRKAGCASGTVRYARSKRPRGSVVRQAPRKGLRLCLGVRVNVVVSRGLS